jgi:hypothetical protein
MSSGPTGWLPVIVTSLTSLAAGGSAGAFITTYGGKARDRRKIRSDVFAALSSIEIARRSKPYENGPSVGEPQIAELETKCMLAGVPRELTYLYKAANDQFKDARPPTTAATLNDLVGFAAHLAALMAIGHAADLISNALWHPWRSRPLRHWRARKLEKMISDVSGQQHKRLTTRDIYRIWRELAGHATRRDRVVSRIRVALHLENPLVTQIQSMAHPGGTEKLSPARTSPPEPDRGEYPPSAAPVPGLPTGRRSDDPPA